MWGKCYLPLIAEKTGGLKPSKWFASEAFTATHTFLLWQSPPVTWEFPKGIGQVTSTGENLGALYGSLLVEQMFIEPNLRISGVGAEMKVSLCSQWADRLVEDRGGRTDDMLTVGLWVLWPVFHGGQGPSAWVAVREIQRREAGDSGLKDRLEHFAWAFLLPGACTMVCAVVTFC